MPRPYGRGWGGSFSRGRPWVEWDGGGDDVFGYRLVVLGWRDRLVAHVRRGSDGVSVACVGCPRYLAGVLRGDVWEGRAVSFLRQVAAADLSRSRGSEPEAVAWGAAHPAVMEYLTADQWPSGGVRVTSTVLVFVEDGVWKACLHDRQDGSTLWVSSGSMPGLMSVLEATLASGQAEWRKARRSGKGAAR